MRRGLAAALLVLLVLLVVLARAAVADLVFRVPEVLVRHAAAARPVGTGGRDSAEPASGKADGQAGGLAAEGQEASGQAAGLLEVRYEEYFVEHDISTAAARNAALHLDLDTGTTAALTCQLCNLHSPHRISDCLTQMHYCMVIH
ncbi:PREDICTED: uncharacterized protein LOC106104521 [Papilio polytes]|uniref:uncharacterized protein LOC106104521 n=1 Tax=Papilio polytes TaxID=76194 RepID=UPI000675BEDC|nr:PREDICTED: uncharacterized protein LOC106104521 [Papilio polytes]